ncbi:MAG: hypothetical protein RL358_1594 [Pseudomonadota bacterium]|jgi:uncharacterized membrane protein
MDLYTQVFNAEWLLISNYLFAAMLLRAIWTGPWQALWRNSAQFNLLIGVTIWVGAFWLFPVGMREGLKLHPLGATLFFLLFDWQIATLLLSAILLVALRFQHLDLSVFGMVGLIKIAAPIALSWFGLRLFYRYGKPNYFAFVLWNGYCVSGITMLMVASINGWCIASLGKYSAFILQNSYWVTLPTISSSEAILTGLAISGFAVALPQAVAHFNADVYFTKKPPE